MLFEADGEIAAHRSCRNVAPDPKSAFEIDPADLIAAHRAARNGGPSIAGYYHSHPTGAARPSARDAASAEADGKLWLIVAGKRRGLYRTLENGAIEGRFEAVEIELGE